MTLAFPIGTQVISDTDERVGTIVGPDKSPQYIKVGFGTSGTIVRSRSIKTLSVYDEDSYVAEKIDELEDFIKDWRAHKLTNGQLVVVAILTLNEALAKIPIS